MKPDIINTGFKVSEKQLHKLGLPTEEMPISELIANADIPYLEKEGTDDWNLSPNLLIRDFATEHSHASRVDKADLNYPIYIYKHYGQWIILDGVHRFTKALMLGKKTIGVKIITDKLIKQIL